MVKDYKDFLENCTHSTPEDLDKTILSTIKKEMRPKLLLVLAKLISIQAFIGTITLLFCPQFNFSLTNSYALFHIIHESFGHHVCMIVCGSIFLGTGALFAGAILNRYEIRAIGKSYPLYYVALTGTVVSIFILAGTDVYLDMASLWALGAIGSSCLLYKTGNLLKARFTN